MIMKQQRIIACGGVMDALALILLFNITIMMSHVNIITGAHEEISDVDQNLCSSSSPNHYDYEEALGKGILYFEGQRSGKLPPTQRARWRGDSGLRDGQLEEMELVGGYYDAGDNVKYSWPMAFSATLLSWATIEHQWQLSSTNELGHIQSAIAWATTYLTRAHVSTTTLYTQVGDGNIDRQCWERPEDMDTPRTLYKVERDSPGTEVAAEVAAAFAAASFVFKTVDPRHSSQMLKRAKTLFQFADKNRKSYQDSCPFYCSYSGYEDELLWAAAWLYKATGENMYLNYIFANQGWSHVVTEFSWDNKLAGVQILMAKEFLDGKTNFSNFKNDADSFVCAIMPGSSAAQIKTTPGGLLYTRDTGNMQYATSAAMILLYYSNILDASRLVPPIQCGSMTFTPARIRAFAKSQIDYILGKNPLKMSYMVGFGSKYPMQLHHRGASIPSIHVLPDNVGCTNEWYSSTMPNPNVHVGAIVGGPIYNDQFNDLRSDYNHLEPTTYTNAAFVGCVAALLAQVKQPPAADDCLLMPRDHPNTTTNHHSSTYNY